MAKIMIFVDGSWLYANQYILSAKFGDNYRLDYGKLPKVLGEKISKELGSTDVDIVRTYLFGSNAINYDIVDEQLVQNRKDFYGLLKEEYHYEVEVFYIDYRGRRLKKADRKPDDEFYPQEKCVDIALATSMLYFAAIPYAYDIAIAVIGDRDFIPLLQYVRRLGKRVAIASIKESCAYEYSDPKDDKRLKDFDIIWLDDLLDQLELKVTRRPLECQSHLHRGSSKIVYTEEPLRKGQKFYCKECREKLRQQKSEEFKAYIPVNDASSDEHGVVRVTGEIKKLIFKKNGDEENRFGFIKNEKGDFYFHCTDLSGVTNFDSLKEGQLVKFDITTPPNPGHPDKPAGKATNIEVVIQ